MKQYTAIEQQVRDLWQYGGYHGHTFCAYCGQDAYCCGLNPESRICVTCFEFEFNSRLPRSVTAREAVSA